MTLTHLNSNPLLKKVVYDLNRWINVPVSLIGRIATVKMTILPKINYIFSMIPTQTPLTWFNSTITIFYWEKQKNQESNQKHKNEGGLEAPNFCNCFLAIQLQFIINWIHPIKQSNPWIEIEQAQCQEISISNLPFINCTIKRHSCFKANTISTTLTAWWKAYKSTNSTLAPCKYTPLWNNPNFLHNKKTLKFHHLERKRHYPTSAHLSTNSGSFHLKIWSRNMALDRTHFSNICS